MDPEATTAQSAETYVATVQRQIQFLHEQLGEGQTVEAVVCMSDGSPLFVNHFGFENPDLLKLIGTDADGHEVCYIAHKSSLQIMLRKTKPRVEVNPQVAFQGPEAPKEILIDQQA